MYASLASIFFLLGIFCAGLSINGLYATWWDDYVFNFSQWGVIIMKYMGNSLFEYTTGFIFIEQMHVGLISSYKEHDLYVM